MRPNFDCVWIRARLNGILTRYNIGSKERSGASLTCICGLRWRSSGLLYATDLIALENLTCLHWLS